MAAALQNAREQLVRSLAESASQRALLEGVAGAFSLEGPPKRIEVYDNSHIQGSHAVGAMIVAGPEGLMKNAYRKFTIRGVEDRGLSGEALLASAPTPTLPRLRGRGPTEAGKSLPPPQAGEGWGGGFRS